MQLYAIRKNVFSLFLLLFLAACGARTTPEPTMDLGQVYTQAAQTVAVQLTQTALAQPTFTPLPTETPTTAAPAPIVPQETAAASQPPVVINTALVLPSATLALPPLASPTGSFCNNSVYMGEVGFLDGAVLKPGQPFDKGWLLKNTGYCDWTIGYYLLRIGGNSDFSAPTYTIQIPKQIVAPGQIGQIMMHMVAPKTPGKYEAFYQMYSNQNVPFGSGVSVSIVVKR